MKLPQPSAEALEQSGRLVSRLQSLIDAHGGWISFARYMELALYAPGLGYYSGGAHKFGPGGDFITAPELTPLFGQALASQVQQIMGLSAPHVIEAGAGTGLLAADLLLELELRGALPESYAILEARDAIGGTWDLFRYPGIRSDSDMYTLGYNFKPWPGAKALADGPSIREYVRETARESGIEISAVEWSRLIAAATALGSMNCSWNASQLIEIDSTPIDRSSVSNSLAARASRPNVPFETTRKARPDEAAAFAIAKR